MEKEKLEKEDEDFKKWLREAACGSVDKINDSAIYLGLHTRGCEDIKRDPLYALQLGIAILLDKPIVVIATDDQPIPKNLVAVARITRRVNKNDPAEMANVVREALESVKI